MQGCLPEKASALLRTIKIRIQRRVVVHLELAIDLVMCHPGGAISQQLLQAGGQIGALLGEADQLGFARGDVLGRGVAAAGLLAHVEDLQRQDGHAVDHAAGGFRIQAAARHGGRQRGEENFVHALDGVIALLVVAVNRALVGSDFAVGYIAAAGQVFFIPQQVVEAVVEFKELPQALTEACCHGLGPAAVGDTFVVKGDDGGRVDQLAHGWIPSGFQEAAFYAGPAAAQ